METKDKKAALKEAGVSVRGNLSDESIDQMYDEHIAESGGPETTPEPEKAPKKKPVASKSERIAAFEEFMEANADPMAGDKTPVVVAYARKNLTEAEFNERYAGRKFGV